MTEIARLFDAARTVRARAYVPYSGYPVGAALLDAEGRIHAAANVENAAYPQSQCAEASAIGVMIAAGGRRIRAVVVVAEGEHLVTPCGGCRQRLREFAPPDVVVHVGNETRILGRFTMTELLPHAFGPDHLAGPTP
jgi:cytidine deaminase